MSEYEFLYENEYMIIVQQHESHRIFMSVCASIHLYEICSMNTLYSRISQRNIPFIFCTDIHSVY